VIGPVAHAAVAFGGAFVAGMINSVAGGGTLVSFPTLIWLGIPSVTANATSRVAIWPGSLGAMWGYRRELRTAEPVMLSLVFPSLLGGIAGALLLRYTPPALFDTLVPFLILFATLLFMVQAPTLSRFLAGESPDTEDVGFRVRFGFVAAYFFRGLAGGRRVSPS
jgi:uncharacterized membrane protein YfcA